jgi:exopolyphosphatase / guanosine-5'-triphosphate,3'-diphosphate pyrophosphatase
MHSGDASRFAGAALQAEFADAIRHEMSQRRPAVVPLGRARSDGNAPAPLGDELSSGRRLRLTHAGTSVATMRAQFPDEAEVLHAAVDIGTNSLHLVIARIDGKGAFEIVGSEKDQVRLGSGSSDMRELSSEAIDRGIAALTRYRRLVDAAGADLTAVATSAIREADNRHVFLDRAAAEAGVDVEVISGIEEARLIHLGILQALPVLHQRLLLIDIGGGSTEFLVGQDGAVIDARSMKLGAIRLTDRFFPGGEVDEKAVAASRSWINHLLTPVAQQLRPHGYSILVGSSGTIENLAAMIELRRGNSPNTLNNVTISRAELGDVVGELVGHRHPESRRKVKGLDSNRADTIVAGAVLLDQSMALFGCDELTVSTFALREGVLLDRFHRSHGDSFHHLNDIRRRSVRHLARLFDEDHDHVEHATDLALRLFDDLQTLHRLDATRRDLLEAAGWVHNVGLFISHSAHHKHSYYVIRNSDRLVGFTDHEIELIAQVARYHRRSAPKAKHPEFAALTSDDQRTVCLLAGLLRLGIALDRSHDSRVVTVDATIAGGDIIVEITATADDTLERYTFDERKGLLEHALDAEIRLA